MGRAIDPLTARAAPLTKSADEAILPSLARPPVVTMGGAVGQVARNGALMIVARALGLGAILPLNIVLANRLGPELYGIFAFASTTAAILLSVGLAGLDFFVAREVARRPRRAREIFGLALLGSLGTTALLALVVAGLAVFGASGPTAAALQGYAVGLLFMAGTEIVLAVGNGFERFTLRAMTSIAMNLLKLGLGVGIVLAGGGVVEVVWALVVAHAVTFVLALTLVSRQLATPRLPKSWRVVRWALARSLPLALWPILGLLYFRSSIWLLGLIAGPGETAIYQAGLVYFDILITVSGMIGNTLLPTLSRLYVRDQVAFVDLVRLVLRYTLLAAFFAVQLAVLAGFFIQTTYTADYARSATVIVVLGAAVFASFANGILVYALIAAGRNRQLLWAMGVTAALSIGLNAALVIPRFGAIGSAVVTVGAEYVVCGLYLIALTQADPRIAPMGIVRRVAAVGLVPICLLGATLIAGIHPLFGVIGATMVYLIGAVQSGHVREILDLTSGGRQTNSPRYGIGIRR